MRDTLLIVLILGAVALGLTLFRKVGPTLPTLAAGSHQVEKNGAKVSPVGKSVRAHKGESNERTNVKSAVAVGSGQSGEASAGDNSEGESLPSIYSGNPRDRRDQNPEGGVKPRTKVAKLRKNSKMLLGVPVDDYLLSHRDSILVPEGDNSVDLGVRLYLQCLDVTRKPTAVGKHRCDELYGAIARK